LTSFPQLFGHENVSVLDGGLERWIADGYETTNMMMKKRVCAAVRPKRQMFFCSGSLICYQVLFHFSKGFTFFEDISNSPHTFWFLLYFFV